MVRRSNRRARRKEPGGLPFRRRRDATANQASAAVGSKGGCRWYHRWGGAGIALGLRNSARFVDCKIAYHDRSIEPRFPEHYETIIGVFWHEYLSAMVAIWADSSVAMLVSRHRDAEWLNQAAERLGFSVVRGSTRRGGSRAVWRLRRLCKSHSLGITPDGPRGPRRVMSVGPVFLASLFDMPLVPVGVGYERPWRLPTWDRFALARPFSRARVITGPKLRVPPNLSRDDLEDYRIHAQQMIEQLTCQAEDWANSNYDLRGQISFRGGQLRCHPIHGAPPIVANSSKAA
jgi:lysophospholipid acyltransferase (LPLAT)-like uncharacterized protein